MSKPLLVKRHDGSFWPASEHDAEALAPVPVGACVKTDPKQPRNPGHHRKAFAMLHQVHDNLPDDMPPMTFARFYSYMKVAAGAVDEIINHKGEVFYVVKSLSFADMDQIEFEEIYGQFVTVAYERLGMEWVLEQFA